MAEWSRVAGVDTADMLKEAGLTAFVALMLSLPMAGFQTVGSTVGLRLTFRPLFVVVPVLVVFVGRLLLIVWRHQRRITPYAKSTESVMDRIARGVSTYAIYIGPLLFLCTAVLPFLPFSNRYLIDTATSVLIYVMLGWGLNIVVGLAGLLDLGYVAFYAVGAYSYALLATEFGWSFWTCLPLAGFFAALAGVILGFPVLRLRGDYLAIVTLGFGEIIRLILLNWYDVTHGPDGISRIPRPTFFGLPFTRRPTEGVTAFHQFFDISYSGEHRVIFLYYLILVLALLTNIFTQRLRKLPVGRAWEALREDEIACRSLGINPTNTKLTAFGLGALFGGFAGAFFATRQGFISPESFSFIESAIILSIVVLGGMGSQIGVVLAAVLLIVLPELGRALAQFRMLVFGGAMVAIMVWRPGGLLAYREPTLLFHDKRREGRGAT
ncbi:hypothetical protein NKDENANG_03353 [Candidatus Entotheonellaceae bacterium PAL068K]